MAIEFSFVNSYNDKLYGYKWEINNPKANIILITGMVEHTFRYDKFCTFLNENGYSVYGLDHYGQGKNGNPLGAPGKDFFFKYIETAKELRDQLKSKNNLPVYIFAHSMGSFISQGIIEKYSSEFDKIVLCGSNGKSILFKLAKPLANIYVNKKNEKKTATLLHKLSLGAYAKVFKGEGPDAWLSKNTENIERYKQDPFSGYIPNNEFYKEFFRGLSTLHNKKKLKDVDKNLKVLIVGGSDDVVGNFGKGLIKLDKEYKKYGINTELIIYDGLRHEIINEENNQYVYQDIVNFYEKN